MYLQLQTYSTNLVRVSKAGQFFFQTVSDDAVLVLEFITEVLQS